MQNNQGGHEHDISRLWLLQAAQGPSVADFEAFQAQQAEDDQVGFGRLVVSDIIYIDVPILFVNLL